MNVENRQAKITNESKLFERLFRDIKIARHLIESPEYFYQQPTFQQEEKFKEDYFTSWEKLSKKEKVGVPKTINTFFGKIEFIKDAIYFNNLLKNYKLVRYRPGKIFFMEKGSSLLIDRKKTYEKLDSLSPEEIIELQAKTANAPLQIIDFPKTN